MADTQTVAVALYRSVLGVFVPGIFALVPWFLLARQGFIGELGFAEFPSVGYAFGLALAAIVGSVCNGLGTWLEKWFDTRRGKAEILSYWWDYLSRRGPEPVGFRYLSRLFTSLSFELAMVTAGPLSIIGLCLLLFTKGQLDCVPAIFGGFFGSLFAVIVFGGFAYQTHGTICKARKEILNRLPIAPSEPGSSSEHH